MHPIGTTTIQIMIYTMCACYIKVLLLRDYGQYCNKAKGNETHPELRIDCARALWGKTLRSSERAVLRAQAGDYRRTANSWMTDQRRH